MRKTIFLLALLTSAVAFAQHPNLAKGFSSTGVYQYHGLDSVNAFNGNLNVRIPIGETYSVAPGLSYKFGLIWNSNSWKSREEGSQYQDCCTIAYPTERSNAGFGWTFSLGRLHRTSNPSNGGWTYESPDGADHPFYKDLHPTDDSLSGDPAIGYTRDGSYLRMKFLDVAIDANDRAIVEFPDGTVHQFKPPINNEGPWLLETITNQFSANYVNVGYSSDAQWPQIWTISDSRGRQHKVYFRTATGHDEGDRLVVDHFELAAFGNTKAIYTLGYLQNYSVHRPSWHDPEHHSTVSQMANLWLLDTIQGKAENASTTAPENINYAFKYSTGSLEWHPGYLRRMTLPTGANIVWHIVEYSLPIDGPEYGYQQAAGVWARMVYGRGKNPDLDNQSIADSNDPDTTVSYRMTTRCDPISSGSCFARDSVTTVRNYDGRYDQFNPNSPAPVSRTEYFFSVSGTDTGNWKAVDYGQPFTVRTTSMEGLPLTQRSYAGTSSSPLISTYARYTADYYNDGRKTTSNVRLESKQVSYDTDPVDYDGDGSNDGPAWVMTMLSSFDGLGNYRGHDISSTIPGTPSRLTFTNHNPERGIYPGSFTIIPTTSPWWTGKVASTTITEGGRIQKSEFLYNTQNFLTRARAIKDATTGARASKDVITVFTADTRGNIASEEHYGGDSGSVGTQNLDVVTLGTRISRIDHAETTPDASGNWKESSQYLGASDLARDVTIDRNTGAVAESRDSAGLSTAYVYDFMGRMTRTKPTGRAWTVVDYTIAGNSEVATRRYPNGQQSGTALTSERHSLDGLGRVTREWITMPGGTESYRDIEYDAFGRRKSVSELGTPSAKTTTTYDALGRPLVMTAPDGSTASFSYTGARKKTRTTYVATPLSTAKSVVKTDEYDGFGRLIAVTEPTGPTTATAPNGSNVRTEYTYDLGDHLTSVVMNRGASTVQHRFFEYDGRGLLRWESQPESGLTSYEYDARGNMTFKRQAGDPSNDLLHVYDSSGRLIRVDVPNPLAIYPGEPAMRPIKEFTYGTANVTGPPADYRKGKLVDATRYNYRDMPWITYLAAGEQVTHTYGYHDAAGRLTKRTTTISLEYNPTSIVIETAYNDLDLPTTVSYPMCTGCGYAPGITRSSEVRSYDRGRLVSLTGFLSGVTYWPNGMRYVKTHSNGIADTQQVGAMARPTSIAFGEYDRCVKPSFSTQPTGGSVATAGAAFTLTATASGTSTIHYDWYNGNGALIGDTQTITVYPTATTEYYVVATNDCGETYSRDVKVTVNSCATPQITSIQPILQPDGSWILTPSLVVRNQSLTFEWRRLPDTTTVVGTTETLAVSALTATTTYRLTVYDVCGTVSSDVTIAVPMTMTTTALTATANAARTQITVTWPAVSGATSYSVERRFGADWTPVASPTTTSYVDTNIVAGRVYAYRARAMNSVAAAASNYSNTDVAATTSFPVIVAGDVATTGGANTMLAAVNLVREAAGWPAMTWATILSPTEPVVASGNAITSRQLLACRTRMDEALLALGARGVVYTDVEVAWSGMKAVHVNELQGAIQ